MKIYNFSAGPAILPQSVIEQAAQTVLKYNDTGLSILEVSHRGKDFVETMDKAVENVRALMNLSDDYEVLFLTGGASTQFFMIPMNILAENQTAGYIDTGAWSAKAIEEAKLFGNVEVLTTSKETTYDHIPKNYVIPDHLRYLHVTSNNTIYGTQFQEMPNTDIRLVCDMSSDIFSRPVDASKYDIIYAGAQKNMGPAGTTLVILKKDILGKVQRQIPTMLDYNTHIKKGSMFNTPPVFPIYVSMLTMQWVIDNGGLEGMDKRNTEKAELLYSEIDRNPLFKGHAAIEDRSKMNVTFNINDSDRESAFVSFCEEIGISGIKGHRSVGGFRASIYNAMDLEGVQVLVDAMQEFERIS
jgi:phosphoserine aminotransferase